MLLTPFGKEARRLRIDKDLLLKDVADRVGVTPAFISAIEAGRKPIPAGFVGRVAAAMDLTPEESKRLQAAADLTVRDHRIALREDASPLKRETASLFARNFDALSEEEVRKIRSILSRRRA